MADTVRHGCFSHIRKIPGMPPAPSGIVPAITGGHRPPLLLSGALSDKDLAGLIRSLHEAVMSGSPGTGELNCLLSALIPRYGRLWEPSPPRYGPELARVCAFLEENLRRHVTLDQLCRCAGLSKSTLLRAFTRWKGITLGQRRPETVGEDVCDGSGRMHAGIIEFPVPILAGDPDLIRSIREQLCRPEFDGLTAVDFSDLAQGCKTYGEYIEKMGAVPEEALVYRGLALCGPAKQVSRLTGSMALLR